MGSKAPQLPPMKQATVVRTRRHLEAALAMIAKLNTSHFGHDVRVKEVTAKPLNRSIVDWLFGRKRKWEVTVEFCRTGDRPASPPPPRKP
jgi:hypothetical protein